MKQCVHEIVTSSQPLGPLEVEPSGTEARAPIGRQSWDTNGTRKLGHRSTVSHNQLAEAMDQLKIKKYQLEGTCNHQEEELNRYRTLFYERGLENPRSNSKSPDPSTASNGEKTAQKLMRFPDPPMSLLLCCAPTPRNLFLPEIQSSHEAVHTSSSPNSDETTSH